MLLGTLTFLIGLTGLVLRHLARAGSRAGTSPTVIAGLIAAAVLPARCSC